MKKIIATFAMVIAMMGVANAQEFKVGAKGGLNLATFGDISTGVVKTSFGFKPSYYFGAFIEYGFNEQLWAEVGIAYSSQGAKTKSVETTLGGISVKTDVSDTSTTINQLNVPIWLKYDIAGFRPKVGVNLGFAANAKGTVGSNSTTVDLDKTFDFGAALGAEYNFPMGLFVEAAYTHGFTEITSKGANKGFKNRVLQIGVGYKF
nr:porin family protein [uncultured Capnocytophaga sp.]